MTLRQKCNDELFELYDSDIVLRLRNAKNLVVAVDDIPYTINMKKVEKAVTSVIHNEPVLNLNALANPLSLKQYKDLEELKT